MLQITLHCDSAYSWTHPIFIRWLSFRSFPNFQQFLINKEGSFFPFQWNEQIWRKPAVEPFQAFPWIFSQFPVHISLLAHCTLFNSFYIVLLQMPSCFSTLCNFPKAQFELFFSPGELYKKCFWKSFFSLLIFDGLLE